jgi:hypothetical protein
MNVPAFIFGTLLSAACSLLYHLLRGGSLSRLVLYMLAGWISFFLGHFIGEALHWELLRYGSLNLFPALMATALGLFSASFLAGQERPPSRRKRRRPPRDE